MSDTFWSGIVDQGVNDTAVQGALAPTGSPERAKKALDLSIESGIPAPVIELNIEKAAEEIEQRKRAQAVRDSEGLQLYIQGDRMAPKISSDDFDPLKRIYDDLITWANEDPILQAVGEGFGTEPLGLTPGGETEEFFRTIGLIKSPTRADPGTLVTEPVIRGAAAALDLIGRTLAAGVEGAGAGVEVLFNDLNEAIGGKPLGEPQQARREMMNFVNFLLLRFGMERPFRPPQEAPINKLEQYLKTAEELRPKPTRPNWHDVGQGGVNTELLRLEHQAIKTEYEAATLDATVQAATESATRQRSPAMFEKFVTPAVGDRTIIISAEAARDLYVKAGKTPGPGDAILGWIPDIGQKIQLELSRGGDIQIPLAGYLAHIDPLVHKELLPSVRSASGMSIKEVQETQAEIEEALEAKKGSPAVTVEPAGENSVLLQTEGLEGTAALTINPDHIRIGPSVVASKARGKGFGIALYEKAIEFARERGLPLRSSFTVSPDAVRVYEALQRRGYTVTLNSEATRSPNGGYTAPSGSYVFEVDTMALEARKEAAPPVETVPEAAPAAPAAPAEPAGTVTLESRHERYTLPDGQNIDYYNIVRDGKPIGHIDVSSFPDKPGEIHISSIGPAEGIDAPVTTPLGTGAMKQGVEELKRLYPSAKIITGLRSTGARGTGAVEIVIPGPIEAASTKAREALFLDPLFADAKSAGMTETEFKLYSEKVARVFENAYRRDLKYLERIATRELTTEWKTTVSEEIVKAEKAFDARLDVQAEAFLTTGMLDPTIKVGEGLKLRTSEVNAPNLRDMVDPKGVSPDEIAGLLGYRTGQELVDALSALKSARGRKELTTYRKEVTRAEAVAAAEVRFGDVEARVDAITAGITDPDISKVLYDELRVMQKQGGGTPLTFEEMLRRSQVYFNDYVSVTEGMRTQQYVRNLTNAGRKAEMALLKGKIPEAFKAKNEQLLAFFDMQQAISFKKEMLKAGKFIAKYARRKPPKTVDPHYSDQIQKILDSYGVSIRRPRQDIRNIPSLAEFLAGEYDLGFEIPVAPELLEPTARKNWREIPVREFRALMESLTSLEHVGRDKLTGIVAGQKVELALLQGEINANLKTLPLRHKRDVGVREKLTHAKNAIDSYVIRMAELFNDLDLGNPDGPLTQAVYRTILDAQHKEIDVYFKEAVDHIGGLPRIENSGKKIVTPWHNDLTEKPFMMTKADIVMLALNLGNRENRALVAGTLEKIDDMTLAHLAPYEIEVITENAAGRVIDFVNQHMTEKDWQFVTGLWEYFNKLKPEIDRMYRDLTGVAPDTVEALPIETPFGVMPGGYSRIIYDPVASDITAIKALKNTLFDRGHAKATTPNSYTKKRTGARKPFLVVGYYEMLPIEIRKMLHDLAFREALLNAQKIFSKDVRYNIRKYYGEEYEGLIDTWIKDIANHFNEEDNRLRWLVNLMRAFRSNTTTVALGLNPKVLLTPNISPMMMNPLDYQRFISDPGAMKFVMDNSAEVRDRMLMFDRDVGDFLRGHIGLEGKAERIRAGASRFGMYLAVKQDAMLASALWYGQYQRALESGMSHEDAVFRGDLAVIRNFGSQTTMNLPTIMRGSEAMKTFTMFLGFMNTVYNRQRVIVALTRSGMKKVGGGEYAGATRDFLMAAANTWAWVLTVAAFGWFYAPNTFDDAEDWDEWGLGFVKLIGGNLAAEMPFVRDVAAYLLQDFNPRGNSIYSTAKEVSKPIFDAVDWLKDDEVSDRWIEHAVNSVGYIVGLPTASPSRAAQYLWNTTTNQDDMDTFGDFMRGVLFGRSDPNKK